MSSLYAPDRLGGVERVVETLVEALVGRGHAALVICTTDGSQPSRDRVGPAAVDRLPVRNVYPLRTPRASRRLLTPIWHAIDTANPVMRGAVQRVLERERPDVVHTHNLAGLSALAWSAAAKLGIPIVHTVHDYYVLCPRSSMISHGRPCEHRHFTCSLYSRPRVRLSRHVDAAVGVSRFVLERHTSYGAFSRATKHVVGNPCRLSGVESHARSDGAVRLGYLGRLEEAKGIDVLLDAVGRVQGSNWDLRIGGTGYPDYERQLKSTYTDARIHFLGFTDARSFLADLDVLVVPPRCHEAFPMVAVEALGAGIPVIAAHRGGLPEIVEDGATGSIFDPDDPAALPTVIDAYLSNPDRLRAMREACRRRAGDFSVDRISGEYDAIYKQVARRSPP